MMHKRFMDTEMNGIWWDISQKKLAITMPLNMTYTLFFQKWCEPSSSLTIFYWKLHILSFTIHLLRISISHGHVSFSAGKIVIPLQRDIYICVYIYKLYLVYQFLFNLHCFFIANHPFSHSNWPPFSHCSPGPTAPARRRWSAARQSAAALEASTGSRSSSADLGAPWHVIVGWV